MSAILEARGLTRDYSVSRGAFRPRATVKALNGVSFSLHAGRTLAVVGESGSGKSTLARLLTLIENPTAGSLLIDGEDVAHASAATRARLRREIQIVFQNPYGSLNPRQTIGKALEEPLLVNTTLRRRRAQGRGSVDHGQGRLKARILSSLSAYVLGRPAPAHRDRPRAHAEAEDPGARRAGVGAGCFDPRAGAQPARQLAGGIRSRLCVRLARSFGRAPYRRRGDGDLPRQNGRARRAGRNLRFPAASLYAGAPVRDADRRPDRQARQRILLSGEPPSPFAPPPGCPFNPRCRLAFDRCRAEEPPLERKQARDVACWAVAP